MIQDPPPWALTIPNDLRLLSLARAFMEAVCGVVGMDDVTTHAVVLATDEATNNVMRHAYRELPQASLHICCFPLPDGIEVRITDEGCPFDLEAVPEIPPGEIRVGGRGVFLMRRLMDVLECLPRPEGGNVLRMVKKYRRGGDAT